MALSTNGGHDESQNTRHWSFTVSVCVIIAQGELTIYMQAFEWVVRDVHRLRDYVENINTVSDVEGCDFDILKESPMLGDGKFKLEIGNVSSTLPVDSTHLDESRDTASD